MKIIECPRDAMQGLHEFVPTQLKIKYINQLLKVGFDTIDFGSFVSPKAIPQLKDTAEVLAGLEIKNKQSKLLAIIANTRGAMDASQFKEIDYLGFPLSLSETFQRRNTNKSIAEAFEQSNAIQDWHSCALRQLAHSGGHYEDHPDSPAVRPGRCRRAGAGRARRWCRAADSPAACHTRSDRRRRDQCARGRARDRSH